MRVLRNATAWTSAVCLASVLGCASSQSRTSQAPAAPQTARMMPRPNPSLRTEQLIHIADALRLQGKQQQAAEVYGWVLEREPNNLTARQRMAMLPLGVASRPRNSAAAGGQSPRPRTDAPRLTPPAPRRSLPPAPASGQQPLQRPPAPGAVEDVPEIPGSQPYPKSVPPAPGVIDSAMTRYQAASGMPTTIVRGATASDDGSTHTIQIIPASKGGMQLTRELKVSAAAPADAPGPFRVPVENAPFPAAGVANAGPSAAVAKPALPHGLRDLGAYVDAPGRHVAGIAARLHDDSADVRSLAAFLLGRAGTDARSAVPALESLLASEQNGPTRIRAAEALLRISPQHAPALQTLLTGLSSSERAVRWEAVCVADVVKDAPQRIAVLMKVIDRLQDVESRIRVMAALKLGDAKSDKAVAVAALDKVLQNPQSTGELKTAAIISLAALRSEPRGASRPKR